MKEPNCKIIGSKEHKSIFKASYLDTPLGQMLAIGNDENLHILEFQDRKNLDFQLERFQIKAKSRVIPGRTNAIDSIEKELNRYFEGKLKRFTTPLELSGTPFQKRVWEELQKIPFGMTLSYSALAKLIGKPTAFRAVGLANGANSLAIIIPCHRVINAHGSLGGYAGGIMKKKWLLDYEKSR